jgi:hypothetical protein
VPIARRSAIHPTVIVVSARQRAAKATFTESPLGRDLRSASCPRPRRLLAVMLRLTADSTDLLAIIKQEGKI